MPGKIPKHLQKYVVEQKLNQYTAKDHAVWRFSMRQLYHYLKDNAHESYVEGLKNTGIEIETIPSISTINEKLNQFGWGAIPVSGFIPPTAFMEFQSLGYLPIASDIRTMDHILYTPAPDIIHEAAGHAPIIFNPEFSSYLKKYAEVAKKALLNKDDIELYKAIRELSDMKEHPSSTAEQIEQCETKLQNVSDNLQAPSEAALLSRMNWWTAEYGLIKDDNDDRIYGAGLLSSIGESENSLRDDVKKIPISIDCINYSYDITEEQPQLFTAQSFKQLEEILIEFSETMAYKIGGPKSVEKAIQAETVNTFELNSGVQISGLITQQIFADQKTCFAKTEGPTQISFNNQQLEGHNKEFHSHGYSTIIDTINGNCLSELSKAQLSEVGLALNSEVNLTFDHGFKLSGNVKDILFINDTAKLIKFVDCTITYNDDVYFQPDWGDFDLALGSSVVSVFSGVADSVSYGELYNFEVQTVPPIAITQKDQLTFNFYQEIRDYRIQNNDDLNLLNELISKYQKEYSSEWLAGIELLELIQKVDPNNDKVDELFLQLQDQAANNVNISICILKGLQLSELEFQ